ncbi:hypothetical protein COX22_01585 [Candidatus Falkowbacteria bacterium CG23_combo_of_CG06-09_8_20_14_all_49_15]|uniref:Uncharacterized protein n=1 Tax=Candidatus Falkowbacteria bacterium CG23_combo_of_CG06-09_8_20_14_all_49_15 TaxID=1974572 RepID=A0A2G9ZLA2_9BACT|nr:MAG: hypothetical protein COX22_01585 [Candidatus Falkowbacteria bacterium CG23_combo_of_CG06-09_8_20_14_all_49_15]
MEKKKLIIIFSAFFGLAVIIALFLFFRRTDESSGGETPAVGRPGNIQATVPTAPASLEIGATQQEIKKIVIAENPIKSAVLSKLDLEKLAASFAERFGSYSNQANFANIRDLQVFMTEKMRRWSAGYIQDLSNASADSTIYYGISTKAVGRTFSTYDADDGRAEILISTRRRESFSTAANSKVFSQDIKINLIKQNDVWLVDGAFWLDKD